MTAVFARFVPSYKARGRSPGFGTLGDFMVSDQIRKPLVRASLDIIALAKLAAPRTDDGRKEQEGRKHYADRFSIQSEGLETLVFDSRVGRMNRHAMVQISNDSEHAVAMEYGSGIKSEGTTSGEERRQKQLGWNMPERVLGKAGRKIGRAAEEK